MNTNFDFHTPTRIFFGSGSINELGNLPLPGKRALLLMSAGQSAKISGGYEKTIEGLKKAGVEEVFEFAKVMENPLNTMVMEGAAFAQMNDCDFIVALGGGSVLDAATAISAMATNKGDLWDYVWGGTGKCRPLKNPGLPVVTIPLTAGTGSEVNCWGVISNLDTKEKIGFGDPMLNPVLAIVDPELMRTVPPLYTAYQGFDALFHHTEVMMSNGVNIMSEALALSAIENIATYLPRAVADGNDLEARERVAYASTMAGLTMQLTTLTAQHSMEHALSAYHHDLPHGAGLIMISKEFAQFFIDRHACDEQFIKMARVMGIPQADKPQDFLTALLALQEKCGVANLRMCQYGVEWTESVTLAEGALTMQGNLFLSNPCEMTLEDCAGIFERSYR